MRVFQFKPFLLFLLRSVVAGLAIAFVLLYFFPEFFNLPHGRDAETIGPAAAGSQSQAVSYNQAVAISAPSVVNIYASKVLKRRIHPLLQDPIFRRFFGDQSSEQQLRNINLGSGVILNPDGYLVTNAHVINEADEILVTLIDGRQTRASVIGMDPETDLALLQIQLESLPSILIGDSDDLNVGDVVLAIGNPYDIGQTVTQGIVSAKGRKRRGLSTIEGFIQTDADINPGNSGGALINARGQLVGINTVIVTNSGGSQGIGFAIPINLAFQVIRQLLDHGHVSRGYLGVTAIPLPKDTQDVSGQQLTGILVESVNPGGPADMAGMIPGDIITAIDNTQMHDPQQAFELIAAMQPNTEIEIAVIRGWEEMLLKAILTNKPAVPRQ